MNASSIENGLVASRVSRLPGIFGKAQVIALTYQSVLNQHDRDFVTLGRIMSSTDIFRKYTELISHDYVPVTLNDVLRFERGEKEIPPRALAVTFDDGDLDNDSEAAAATLNQAATFYVTVDCVEMGKMPWPSRLRHAFFTTRRKNWSDQHGGTWLLGWNDEHGGAWPLESRQQRWDAFQRACDFCTGLPGNLQEQFLRAIEVALDVDRPWHGQRPAINWNHAGASVVKGHIVASTFTHEDAGQWSDDRSESGPSESAAGMAQALGIPIIHFSYPCPSPAPEPSRTWLDAALKQRAGRRPPTFERPC